MEHKPVIGAVTLADFIADVGDAFMPMLLVLNATPRREGQKQVILSAWEAGAIPDRDAGTLIRIYRLEDA